jgi:hypothetical protein
MVMNSIDYQREHELMRFLNKISSENEENELKDKKLSNNGGMDMGIVNIDFEGIIQVTVNCTQIGIKIDEEDLDGMIISILEVAGPERVKDVLDEFVIAQKN